jgi:long-chain acyl-CoA synthetase
LADAEFDIVVMDEITNIGKEHKLSGLEKPKDFYLTTEQFSIENNLVTPTFKLKRNIAREYYKN